MPALWEQLLEDLDLLEDSLAVLQLELGLVDDGALDEVRREADVVVIALVVAAPGTRVLAAGPGVVAVVAVIVRVVAGARAGVRVVIVVIVARAGAGAV